MDPAVGFTFPGYYPFCVDTETSLSTITRLEDIMLLWWLIKSASHRHILNHRHWLLTRG